MAHVPSLIDMTDDEIELHFRRREADTGFASTSTPTEAGHADGRSRWAGRGGRSRDERTLRLRSPSPDPVEMFCRGATGHRTTAPHDDDRHQELEARLLAANNERRTVEA